MIDDIQLDIGGLLRQAKPPAQDHLYNAYDILEKGDYEGWTVSDAIELAKVLAQDFHTSMMGLKMQEIRDAVYLIANNIEQGLDQ
jgi:hypothetical protein